MGNILLKVEQYLFPFYCLPPKVQIAPPINAIESKGIKVNKVNLGSLLLGEDRGGVATFFF